MMHFSILKQSILVTALLGSLYALNASDAHAASVKISQALALMQTQNLDPQSQGAAKCRAIENGIARLSCYDTLFNTELPTALAEGAAPNVNIPVAPEVPASARELANAPAIPNAVDTLSDVKVSEAPIASNISPEPAMPLSQPVEPVPPPVPPPVPLASVAKKIAEDATGPLSESAETSFGAEQLANKDPVVELNAITATVVDVNESLRGLRTFILDNGQHWSERENNRLRIKKGQEVTLKKGVLGAYYLRKQESNRTVRVNRVK